MGREGGREGDGHFAVKETDTKWEWVSGERERGGQRSPVGAQCRVAVAL